MTDMNLVLLIIAGVFLVCLALYYALIGNIDKGEPGIIRLDEPLLLVGLEISTSDTNIYKDVGRVAAEFNEIKKHTPIPHLKQPWASVNISKDYNRDTRTFMYIMGDVVTKAGMLPPGLKLYEVPAISYAVFTIRPKSRWAWGITMGRMKRFIYTEWLPRSGYELSGVIGDFELHDDRSLGARPSVDLYVALKEKKDQ
jgi:predicted transcriptional regulator YdeE